jgi:predicted nucleotidyltransferase
MTSKLNLPERYQLILFKLLREHVPHAEVLAYGSRAGGQSHDTSDLDLVLRDPSDSSKAHFDELFSLKSALQESDLPILVDVLDWAAIPQSFRNEIEQHHIRLPLNIDRP